MQNFEDDLRNEDNINYKSICCEGIPELFLDKLIAKKHFSKFGKIVRFILRPKRLSCTVEYETEQQAEHAFMESGNYNGYEFTISFAEREVAHVQNTEEWVDPDIQAELEAMNPAQRLAAASNFAIKPIGATVPKVQIQNRLAKQTTATVPTKLVKCEVPKIDATVRNELEAILRRPATTEEDKYRILDARDKLIRLLTVRTTNIKEVKSIQGTCPDMCPEKERLMREFQRQVALFETANINAENGATISHRRAIKEYSRSSADQEVPLAHELRPEPVLQMTMHYLMHHIMDLCNDAQISLGDWFHFVWDRTRSIRKDITQQELCSLNTVELVEQCARFHIHCAARLVAEDPSVFDKKINAENLTKCLQTLKYMYHDLRIKNVRCPCEPEFRGYIVLLNLGNSSFLWEVKQLPIDIQNSKEIRRAIAFYMALQNNNYVRFFSMIREAETTYLSACILLGYFNKLRLRAMNVIIKSYNWRKNEVYLPVNYLCNVLGFESAEIATDFLSYHGLECVDNKVYLDRLKTPDIEYAMERAMHLIESKRTVSVGECVCGRRLDANAAYEKHQPYNSFDENGYLKAEAWYADDKLRDKTASTKNVDAKKQQKVPSAATMTDSEADANIFKTPQTTMCFAPKQKQPQVKTTQTTIFGVASKPSNTSSFGNMQSAAKSIFGSTANNVAAASNETNVYAEQSADSIFKPKPAHKTLISTGNLFDTNKNADASQASSIFGGAAKESANIFQQHAPVPKPLQHDNIFQHFNAVKPNLNIDAHKLATPTPTYATKYAISTNRTMDAKSNDMPTADMLKMRQEEIARNIAEEKKRIQELEMKERLKQQQLKHEQERIKLMKEEAQRKAAEEQQHKKLLKELEECAVAERDKLLKEMIAELIMEVCVEQLALYQSLEECAQQLTQQLLNETIRSHIDKIAQEVHECVCYDQLLKQRYFSRWLSITRKTIHDRKLIECTPMWVTTETRTEQTAKLIHPSQVDNLLLMKRYRYGQPCDFDTLLAENQHALVHQVDIHQIVAKAFLNKKPELIAPLKTIVYFKLVFSMPAEKEEMPGFESLCNRWLKKYVKKPHTPTESSDAYICAMEQRVALCVRKITGVKLQTEQQNALQTECDNMDGVIFFISCVNLQSTRQRLQQLLQLSRLYKPVPVGFVVYNNTYNEQELAELLDLQTLVSRNLISSYEFYGCSSQKSNFRFNINLSKALKFVALESSIYQFDKLEMQLLQNWLETNLGEEVWLRWHESSMHNPAFSELCSSFKCVVALYNEAVELLIALVTNFKQLPELPAELHAFVPTAPAGIPLDVEYFPKNWHSNDRQSKAAQFLKKLCLPAVQTPPPCDFDEMQMWLISYAGLCMPNNEEKSVRAAHAAIKALVQQLNRADLQDLQMDTCFKVISYLPVVKALAFAHVENILETAMLPREIIYQRAALLTYQTQPWWLNSNAIKNIEIDLSIDDDTCLEQQAPAAVVACDEFNSILTRAQNISAKAEERLAALRTQSINSSLDAQIRELNVSLYQFEVAKLVGCFDTPNLDAETYSDYNEVNLNDTIDSTFSTSPITNKRKHSEPVSEMDAIMNKAFDLINRIERKEQMEKKLKIDGVKIY